MSTDEIRNEAIDAFNGCIKRYGISPSPQDAADLVSDIADSICNVEGEENV